jgi:paraquat-inducible protein B
MIDLRYEENPQWSELTYFNDLVVIPTGQDMLAKFTDSIEDFIAKINGLPIENVLEKLDTVLDEGAITLASFQEVAKSADELVGSDRNTELIEQFSGTLASLKDLADSFASESQANRDLQRLLQSASALVEELTPLINQLNNQPNGLVFPSKQPADIEPTRKQP